LDSGVAVAGVFDHSMKSKNATNNQANNKNERV
jgi:hypothetical protein